MPYLDGSTEGIRLVLSLERDDAGKGQKSNPFVILSEADPVGRLLCGEIRTDTNDTIRRLFLLVERDLYELRKDILRPVSNLDVEAAWQRAYAFYRSSSGTGLFTFGAQLPEGCFSRVAPLFFCRARGSFFHPPCPQCGAPLGLCTDDQLLAHAGLAPYSRSVTRYLFCPSPRCADASVFYVRQKAPSDPSKLKDWTGLALDLLLLPDSVETDSAFPCRSCPDRNDCLSVADGATSRLVPFSFYPFYLLAFEAPSVNAFDYSVLLSGASPSEISARLAEEGESGRARLVEALPIKSGARSLFAKAPQLFLEVLYLKLSLLAAVFRDLSADDVLARPDFALSLDKIWVRVAEQDNLLPSYWTFTVRPIDIHWLPPDDTISARTVPGLYYLALVWFSVLISNQSKGIGAISDTIREVLKAEGDHEAVSHGAAEGAFGLGDIFWSHTPPDVAECGEVERSFWRRALTLGWSLLLDNEREGRKWSRDGFLSELGRLRDDVHSAMFDTALAVPFAQSDAHALDDGAIREILEGIIRKWRSRPETGAGEAKNAAEDDEEVVQTVVLSSRTVDRSVPGAIRDGAPAPISPPEPPEQPEELEKTMIISVAAGDGTERGGNGLRQHEIPAASVVEDLEKTVIISASDYEKEMPSVGQETADEDDLEKTVIISAGIDKMTETTTPAEKTPAKRPIDDEMTETVIISVSNRGKDR